MVPSIICRRDGLNSHAVGVDPTLPTAAPTLTRVKHLLYVQPSVSLISNLFDRFFEYPRRSASLLSSAVIWCFLYIRHEFDTAIVANFIKKNNFCRNFSIPFCKKTTKDVQQHNSFSFMLFYDCFFSMLWHLLILDIAKSAVSLSVQGLFSIYVYGVKVHVQHS